MTKFFADIIMIPCLSMLFRLCGRHKNFDGGNRPHVRERLCADAQRSFFNKEEKESGARAGRASGGLWVVRGLLREGVA
jgi:hypothetical protein